MDWDRYAYVVNNPVNLIDPTGNKACSGWDDYENCIPDEDYVPTSWEPDLNTNQNSDYSDWFSDMYGGCFKCHAAVANNQIALTNEQLALINQQMQEYMALGYSPIIALTMIGGALDFAPYIISSIISYEVADCSTDGDCTITRGVVVLGKYPKYIEVAKDINGKIFSVSSEYWNSITPAQQWELNKAFLDQAVARGDYFYLASKWSEATGWFLRELQYLFNLGYTISPNQVWLIPPSH